MSQKKKKSIIYVIINLDWIAKILLNFFLDCDIEISDC